MPPFKAKKQLGQNFLKDENIVRKIVDHAQLQPADLVVEIGPGRGILTRVLAERVRKVIALEVDGDLIPSLKLNLCDLPNVEILHADALKFSPPAEPYHLVANLPYYISSPLLNHFIKEQFASLNPRAPKTCTLMLQKEVAEKLCAKPPHMNVLALHIQPFANPTFLFKVSRQVFSPQPKVDSAVVRIEILDTPKIQDAERFFRLVHAAFSQKRKQLWNSLAVIFHDSEMKKRLLEAANIVPTRRAETLSIDEWNCLLEKEATHG